MHPSRPIGLTVPRSARLGRPLNFGIEAPRLLGSGGQSDRVWIDVSTGARAQDDLTALSLGHLDPQATSTSQADCRQTVRHAPRDCGLRIRSGPDQLSRCSRRHRPVFLINLRCDLDFQGCESAHAWMHKQAHVRTCTQDAMTRPHEIDDPQLNATVSVEGLKMAEPPIGDKCPIARYSC